MTILPLPRILQLLALACVGQALLEPKFISFEESDSALLLDSPTVIVDSQDYVGVHIAANNLASDFGNVTGQQGTVFSYDGTVDSMSSSFIIAGTLNNSRIIQDLVDSGKIDVASIEGKWESFITDVVDDPVDGVDRALVIAGSDKRGAIYGIYATSEQIGVSPWYWWADVAIPHQSDVYAVPVSTFHGEPSVKRRGIFLNDESPSLNTWVEKTFHSTKYNVEFYKRLFELLLRMKANYLWPAMWPAYPPPGNSFFVDDPLNQKTADDYGVVMSTSHQEPMQRSTNEWLTGGNGSWDWTKNKDNVTQFFVEGARRAKGFESYFTIGMRAAGDGAIVGDDPMALLNDIISTQRSIFADVYGNETAVPQVWALYKEVQTLYDQGLQVPDDITLLFSDDNFGNIRRLPNETERQRAGGIGVYYHMEYVGAPRSYKWLNTNNMAKIHHQMYTAQQSGADQIWVFNVADLRPMETPLSMALTMAYNISAIPPGPDGLPNWIAAYTAREFTALSAEDQRETRELLFGFSRMMSMRKHELVDASTFSLVNYHEADRVLASWNDLLDRAQSLYASVPSSSQPSFFQVVLHPIKASQIYYASQIALATNQMFGSFRANVANDWHQNVLDLFDSDYDLQEEWDGILNGKWEHMMRQTHYSYGSDFRAPYRDMISGLSWVQLRQASYPAVGQMGVAVEGSLGFEPGFWNEGNDVSRPSRGSFAYKLPSMSPYGPTSRWFRVYARGTISVHWFADASEDWIKLVPSQGDLINGTAGDQIVNVTVDWSSVPQAFNNSVVIRINTTDNDAYEEISLPITNVQADSSFSGFVEADGYVAFDAPHFTSSSSPVSDSANSTDLHYQILPYLSRGINGSGAIALFPVNASPVSIPDGPSVDYSFYLFSSAPSLNVSLLFTASLDTDPKQPSTFALSFDGSAPNATRLMQDPATPGDLPPGWTTVAKDQVWLRSMTFPNVSPGAHTLRYWAGRPGILLERIIVNLGGLRTSYLGPPESVKV